MSLINEALKKAQRQRTDGAPDASALPGAAGATSHRGPARSGKSIAMIAGGAVALVLVSVLGTYFLFRTAPDKKPQPEKSVAATASSTPAAPATAVATQAPISTPTPAKSGSENPATAAPSLPPQAKATVAAPTEKTSPPKSAASLPANPVVANTPATKPTAPTRTPATSLPQPAAISPSAPPPAAVAAAPTDTPPAAPAERAKPDERIHAFVDACKISGVNASAGRVLMNDRVFRLNDIVDRTLGVRLIKVEVDNLTFSDANGVTYVRYF
jgi:hypothetical protein